jgi:hypothetical protein
MILEGEGCLGENQVQNVLAEIFWQTEEVAFSTLNIWDVYYSENGHFGMTRYRDAG